jgi:hypothetical protein
MSEVPPDPVLMEGLGALVARVFPGGRLLGVCSLGNDSANALTSRKGAGYGAPLAIQVEVGGETRRMVLHTATRNQFGHDRRADRAAEMLLAYDSFERIPNHVRALEVGAWTRDGGLLSLGQATEFYLLTPYAEGEPYALDLRAIAARGALLPRDRARAIELARYLARLHTERHDDRVAWERAARDLFGSGEGLFGIIDSYPEHTPGAGADRLLHIERAALEYRPRLRRSAHRLATIHGDFHPFNLLYAPDGTLAVLDASRGCLGDPADDVTCLSINYLFFGLLAEPSARALYRELWTAFFDAYLEARTDPELFTHAPPYFAWRALVLANPLWYPDFPERERDALLGFAERALADGELSPQLARSLLP